MSTLFLLLLLYIIPLIILLTIVKLWFSDDTTKDEVDVAKCLIGISVIPIFNLIAMILLGILIFLDTISDYAYDKWFLKKNNNG